MTDNLVSPSRSIVIGDVTHVLDGSFSTLRAIQQAFDRDLVQVLVGVTEMRLDEIAKLIAVATGKAADEIGQQILDAYGALSNDYYAFKLELFAWLNIIVTPKADREKKSAEMQTLIENFSSLGLNTSASPSAPSAGSPENSGEATSGN